MKKVLALTITLILVLGLAACGEPEHTHSFGEWQQNGAEHWQECSCGEISGKSAHSCGEATYDAKAVCEVCGAEYGEVIEQPEHTHSFEEWTHDGAEHWQECSCGEISGKAAHSGGEATYNAKAVCEICGAEYGETAEPNTYTVTFEPDNGDESTAKGYTEGRGYALPAAPEKDGYTFIGWEDGDGTLYQAGDSYTATDDTTFIARWQKVESAHTHSGGTATCSEKAVCEGCGEAYGELNKTNHAGGTEIRGEKEANDTQNGYTGDTYCKGCGEKLKSGEVIPMTHIHSTDGTWKYDENEHWNECSCGEVSNNASHSGGTATATEKAVCEVCGQPYGEVDPTNFVKKEGNKYTVYKEYRQEAEDRAYDLLDLGVINGENLKATFQPLMEYDSDKSRKGNKGTVALSDLCINSPEAKDAGVYIGYNDWYFYQDSIEDYEGTNLFSQKELSAQLTKYQRQYDYCKSNGIEYYLSFAPNKNTVYPEYMYEEYTEATYKRLDQLIEYIRANSDIPVIDFRDAIMEEKAANPGVDLYHRIDTHWNQHAAFVATNALLEEIQKTFPAIQLLDKNDFAIKYYETYMKDQAWYLGHYDSFIQVAPQYLPLNGWKAKLVSYNDDGFGQFELAYKWSDGFQEGNHKYVFTNSAKSSAPSAVIFTDSFGAPMLKFLAESFSDTTIYWEDVSLSYIREAQPDVVIVEVAERFLTN